MECVSLSDACCYVPAFDSCNGKPRNTPSRAWTCMRVCNDNDTDPYH